MARGVDNSDVPQALLDIRAAEWTYAGRPGDYLQNGGLFKAAFSGDISGIKAFLEKKKQLQQDQKVPTVRGETIYGTEGEQNIVTLREEDLRRLGVQERNIVVPGTAAHKR
jgi:hypothetical protein